MLDIILGSKVNMSLPTFQQSYQLSYLIFSCRFPSVHFRPFLLIFVFFQATNDCKVTGVSVLTEEVTSTRFCSIISSILISSFFSSRFLSFFKTNPGGRACRYIHSFAPFKIIGHFQNQPYLLFSTASKKCLQIMSV